jgi:hypothetical protein
MTKFSTNIIIIVLVIGNIFFALQYVQSIKKEKEVKIAQTSVSQTQSQSIQFLKLFVDSVFISKTPISSDVRLTLESDVRQLKDADVTAEWEKFVGAKDVKSSQEEALKLLGILIGKLN